MRRQARCFACSKHFSQKSVMSRTFERLNRCSLIGSRRFSNSSRLSSLNRKMSRLALSRLILRIQIRSVEDEKNQRVPFFPTPEEISPRQLLHLKSSGKNNQKIKCLVSSFFGIRVASYNRCRVNDDYHFCHIFRPPRRDAGRKEKRSCNSSPYLFHI